MAPSRAKVPQGAEALLDLGASALRARLASGGLRAEELAQASLARIAEREPAVQAWAWLDGEHVLAQARALDEHRATGRPIGPLHGLPVAVKDIIDTAGMPTENGTALDAGRTPRRDAFVVQRLKAAGALLMGKSVTTELAYFHPGKTRNPHDAGHTPGGSSSGSAAAVAAGMVPLALGTQTAGSVIRPAAFCGVVGFKPTFGAIPRSGVLTQSPSLDTLGVFARSSEDAALLAEALFGYEPGDPASRPAPAPRLSEIVAAGPPVTPMFAFVRPPGWADAEEQTKLALQEVCTLLGEQCFEAPLPNAFDEADAVRQRIQFAEMAKCFYGYERRGREALSEPMRAALDRGKAILARDYIAALDWREVLNAGLEAIFERCDAILTAAAPGPAPRGLESTGNPIFNGLWTLCGTPAVTLPLLTADGGLPMGLQLIGRRGDDGRLLRTARWLSATLMGRDGEEEQR